jgi:predicted lipoprotein with Yx(FWY)xxD motif
MRYMVSRGVALLGLLTVVVLAGCGVTTSAGGGPGASGGTSPTATSTTGQPGTGIVATATASVSGQSTAILTDRSGRTLYYFADDSATVSACTASCADLWPPLIVSSGAPTSMSVLSGTLADSDVGNGMQVLYNGHPLYRYSIDAAPGDTKGEGFEGKWHVATPSIGVNAGPTNTGAQPTPTRCSGYYCY